MRAAIYVRISRDDGTAQGVARQEADCRALCETREWVVAEVLVDNDQSAYSGKPRPGYQRLLDGIERRLWDVVVVWDADRLHRRPVELEGFIDAVEASGVAVSTVTAGEYDLSTPDGRLMARIVGSVARKESEDKSRRLRRKHLELAEQGKDSGGGLRPFGYEPDRVTLRPDEADLIRDAVARVLAGGSLRSIVLEWRDRVPTSTGAVWSQTSVRRVLVSPRIAGLRTHRGETVGEAVWPAIITVDEHLRIRALIAARSTPAHARSYLLGRFLVCGLCDAGMVALPDVRKGRKVRRYACSTHHGGCGRVSVSADGAEATVTDLALEALRAVQIPEPPDPGVPDTAEIEARLVELAELWAEGAISRAEWSSARQLLERRRDKILAVPPKPSWVGGDVDAIWAAAGLEDRRTMLAAVLARVTVAPSKGGNRYDPNRLTPIWIPTE